MPLSGRIKPELQAAPGRALGRFTDIGWGVELRALLAEDAPEAPVSDRVLQGLVRVLAAWDWEQRPVGVVAMPSLTRPRMINDLAGRLCALGRLAPVGSLAYATPEGPGERRHNSAMRLAQVHRALVPAPGLAEALDGLQAETPGPVLLVDDHTDTGWSLTVGAAILRELGAPAVLPLTLATTGG